MKRWWNKFSPVAKFCIVALTVIVVVISIAVLANGAAKGNMHDAQNAVIGLAIFWVIGMVVVIFLSGFQTGLKEYTDDYDRRNK